MDDELLKAGLLDGREDVVELVRQWIRSTSSGYRAALRDESEDVEQDTLLDLTEALRSSRFEARCSLRTYVRAFVHHKCIDRLRARSRRPWIDIDQLDLPSEEPSVLEKMTRKETITIALEVQRQMPPACRELWRMVQEGKTYREMSEALQISEGALRLRVLRCRQKARDLRQTLIEKKI